MTLAPGVAVGQNLRLVRLMAKGGMGSIWVAEHLGLHTQVAVKFIDEALGIDENLLAGFAREAVAAAQIRSPHVVRILDHGSIDGRIPYIVMELLDGESLGSRIARLGRLGVDEIAVIVSQTCKALSRVHALSFVHRDIKPDNLYLIDSGGELFVKVLDFGIAKQKADASLALTSTGTAVGTPHYMSPEQLLSAKNATPATDLWAVGAVAYRALTGELPFDGETYGALCAAISRATFRRATDLRPDLPPALDGWFLRALAHEPEDRFGSARERGDAFVDAAGLTGTRLTVASELPKSTLRDESAAPRDWPGSTLAAPESDFGSAPRTTTHFETAGEAIPQGVRSGTSASFAGTSIPNRERAPRRGITLSVGGAIAVVGVVVGLLLARGGASSRSVPSARAGGALDAPPRRQVSAAARRRPDVGACRERSRVPSCRSIPITAARPRTS